MISLREIVALDEKKFIELVLSFASTSDIRSSNLITRGATYGDRSREIHCALGCDV